jgi:hypothetical protein
MIEQISLTNPVTASSFYIPWVFVGPEVLDLIKLQIEVTLMSEYIPPQSTYI